MEEDFAEDFIRLGEDDETKDIEEFDDKESLEDFAFEDISDEAKIENEKDLFSEIKPKHGILLTENDNFLIDGESILLELFTNPQISASLQNGDVQILHMVYLLESFLNNFKNKRYLFKIAFFSDTEGAIWSRNPAKCLIRRILIHHLQNSTNVEVVHFPNWWTDDWTNFLKIEKPMFILTSEPDEKEEEDIQSFSRTFIMHTLHIGQNCAFTSNLLFQDVFVLGYLSVATYFWQRIVPEKLFQGLIAACTNLVENQENKNSTSGNKEEDIKILFDSFLKQCKELNLSCPETASLLCSVSLNLVKEKKEEYLSFIKILLLHFVIKEYLPLKYRGQFSEHFRNFVEDGDENLFLEEFYRETWSFLVLENFQKLKLKGLCDLIDTKLFRVVLGMSSQVNNKTPSEQSNFFEFSEEMNSQLQSLWKLVSKTEFFPILNKKFKSIQFSKIQSQRVENQLIPISNDLLDEYFQDTSFVTGDKTNFTIKQKEILDFIKSKSWQAEKVIFPDRIWRITEEHEEKKPKSKKQSMRTHQKYLKFMHRYAQSLEGTSIINPKSFIAEEEDKSDKTKKVNNSKGKPEKEVQFKGKHSSAPSKKALIIEEQEAKRRREAKEKEARRWANIQETLPKTSYSNIVRETEKFLQTCNDPENRIDILLYLIDQSIRKWKSVKSKKKPASQINHEPAVKIYMACNEIADLLKSFPSSKEKKSEGKKGGKKPGAGGVSKAKTQKSEDKFSSKKKQEVAMEIYKALYLLGFKNVIRDIEKEIGIKFDIDTEDLPKIKVGLKSGRFELVHMGHLLKRPVNGPPDPRVAFTPDQWQRDLLDIVDKNESALVCAPTSSGKTFISYYSMEKVIKGSKDGVLVFVSPTKALVNQVAAQVYRIFGSGYYGVFTPEYQWKTKECRILITVPECLELLLLTPLRKDWAHKVQYVIFDEVHQIQEIEVGKVWERILLAISCPFLALSATIGKPEQLVEWLQSKSSQKVNLVYHKERYSDLQKYMYIPPKHLENEWVSVRAESHSTSDFSERLKSLHPCAFLNLKMLQTIGFPSDLTFTPPDLVLLYNAMEQVDEDNEELEKLDPDQKFLRNITRPQFREYEQELKKFFMDWVNNEPKKAQKVLDLFQKDLERSTRKIDEVELSKSDFLSDHFIDLLVSLVVQDKFPVLVFNFDKNICNALAVKTTMKLEKLEEEKMSEKEKQLKAEARVREKALKEQRRKRDVKVNKKDEDPTEQIQTYEKPEEYAHQDYTFVRKEHEISPDEFEQMLKRLYMAKINFKLIHALFRGIGVHHADLPKKYREAVEVLFRSRHLKIVIATGTLALGIHMPCRTVVFAGDSPALTPVEYRQMSGRAGRRGYDPLGHVVFYGIPMTKISRLLLSDVPKIDGQFTLSPNLLLRFLSLHSQLSVDERQPVKNSIFNIFNKSLLGFQKKNFSPELKFYLRYSLEFLLRQGILTQEGKPIHFSNLISHIMWAEPSNFVFLHLLFKGVLHKICTQKSGGESNIMDDLMLVLCHIFHRKVLPKSTFLYSKAKDITLPPLSSEVQTHIDQYHRDVLSIYTAFVSEFGRQYFTQEERALPISQIEFPSTNKDNNHSAKWLSLLKENSIGKECYGRSPFSSISGVADSFLSPADLFTSKRQGVYLNYNSLPILEGYTNGGEQETKLNSYLYVFFKNGQRAPLVKYNQIPAGELYRSLADFRTTLESLVFLLQKFAPVSDPVLLFMRKVAEKFHKQVETSAYRS